MRSKPSVSSATISRPAVGSLATSAPTCRSFTFQLPRPARSLEYLSLLRVGFTDARAGIIRGCGCTATQFPNRSDT